MGGGALGFGAVWLITGLSGADPVPRGDGIQLGEIAILIATLLPTAFALIAVHELGHVLGGRLAGFRFQLLVVGPVQLRRVGDRIRPAWNRNPGLAGGLAMSSPRPGDTERLAERMIRVVAGGPLASVALGLVGLVGMRLLPEGTLQSGSVGLMAGSAVAMTGIGSLGIGLVTLIPGRTGGFLTDGARLLRLLRGGPEAEGEAAMLGLIGSAMGGVRPREWSISLLERAARVEDPVFRASALWYRWLNALDRGVGEEADHRREAIAALGVLPQAARPSMAYPLVGRLADVGEVEAARELWETLEPGRGIVDPVQPPLAEASLRLSEGAPDQARALLQAARSRLEQSLDPMSRELAAERITMLERRMTSGGDSAAPPRSPAS